MLIFFNDCFMDFTGERYICGYDSPQLVYEHWHRYLYSMQFVKGKTVLDIACGEGYGSNLLAKTAKKVVGVDIDGETIKYAKKTYKSRNLEFIEGSVSTIPIKGKNVFDVIVSFETIEHVDEEAQKKFLNEVKRLLKPGGIFICSTPNKELYSDLPDHDNEFHVKEFYKDEFHQFLGQYFSNLKLLGQKIFASSNIWDTAGKNNALVEFGLKYDKGNISIVDEQKDVLYFIAICSNSALPEADYSVLTDFSNTLLEGLNSRVLQLQKEVSDLGAWGQSLDAERQKKDKRIVDLQGELEDFRSLNIKLDKDAKEFAKWGETLVAEVGQKNRRIIELQDEVQSLGEWGKKLDEEVKAKDKIIVDLQTGFEKLRVEDESFAARLAWEKERMEEMKKEIIELSERAIILSNEIERLKGVELKLEELKGVIEQLNGLVAEKDRTIADKSRSIEDLEAIIKQKDVFISELKRSFSYKLGRGLTLPLRFLVPPGTKRGMFFKVGMSAFRHPVRFMRSFSFGNMKRLLWALKTENPEVIYSNVSNYIKNKRYLGRDLSLENNSFQIFKNTDKNKKIDFKKEKNPVVSIIIPVYNQWNYTYDCLYSIFENTKDVSYEIIIADDNSTDETKDVQKHVKNIVVARNEKNLGFLLNCKNAARKARGKYLLFLNNDTQVQNEWLKWLVDLAEKDEKIGLVGSKLVYPDGRLQEAGGIIWKDGSGWNYGRLDDPEKPEYNYVKEVDYVSGASILVRKDLWDKIGGFDERYVPAYFEDSDLAFEVRKHGYKVVYQPKSVVVHFEGISHGTDVNSGLKSYQIKNKEKFVKKWKYVLEKHNFDNGKDVFLARDRGGKKKTILVIDHYVPHFDKDAGSKTTFQYLRLFIEMGYNVKFLGDNSRRYEPYTTVLQQLGVEVLYDDFGLYDWKDWLLRYSLYVDFVYLNRPHISIQYLDFIKANIDAKVFYYGHDLHYLRELRQYKLSGDEKMLASSNEWKKLEYEIFKKADVVYYPSDVEIREIKKEFPKINAKAIPAYMFESRDVCKEGGMYAEREDLLFVGSFVHTPNVDALDWFIYAILPDIVKKMPNIKLHVVGGNLPLSVINELKENKNVVLEGYVSEQRLGELYDDSRVVVVPLRYGAGVKGKVVEAMYYGVPVVTTDVGMEGLNNIKGVVVANEEKEYADKLIELYNDADKWNKLSKESKNYVRTHFSKEAIIDVIGPDFDLHNKK